MNHLDHQSKLGEEKAAGFSGANTARRFPVCAPVLVPSLHIAVPIAASELPNPFFPSKFLP